MSPTPTSPAAASGPERPSSATPTAPVADPGPPTATRPAVPGWLRPAVLTILVMVGLAWMAVRIFIALSSFWYTIFLAFFLGLCMEPAVNRLAARGMRRGAATALVMGSLLLGAVAFFAVFGGVLAAQLAEFIEAVPQFIHTVLQWVNNRFGTDFSATKLLDQIGLGVKDLATIATSLGFGLLSLLGNALGLVFQAFTVALFTFYFAADGPRFRRTVASWMTPANQRTFLTVWDISVQKAGGYVISRGLLALISSVFHGVVFFLLDVPYWLPMAIWVGLVSQFIPTLGTYLAGALPTLLTLIQGSWTRALLVLATVVVYQQIENYLVQPRVTRSTLEIHPAVAFGSVIAGTTLFGAVGALLSIPVVATIQSIISTYGTRYELVAELGDVTGESDATRVQEALALYERTEPRPDRTRR